MNKSKDPVVKQKRKRLRRKSNAVKKSVPTTPSISEINNNFIEAKQVIDMLLLRANQQQQILDQYRASIYNLELKSELLLKMLEEKNLMAKEEFVKRWPLYLKNDVGALGPDGKMAGTIKVTMYNGK